MSHRHAGHCKDCESRLSIQGHTPCFKQPPECHQHRALTYTSAKSINFCEAFKCLEIRLHTIQQPAIMENITTTCAVFFMRQVPSLERSPLPDASLLYISTCDPNTSKSWNRAQPHHRLPPFPGPLQSASHRRPHSKIRGQVGDVLDLDLGRTSARAGLEDELHCIRNVLHLDLHLVRPALGCCIVVRHCRRHPGCARGMDVSFLLHHATLMHAGYWMSEVG